MFLEHYCQSLECLYFHQMDLSDKGLHYNVAVIMFTFIVAVMAGARRHLNPFAIVLISNRTGGHFKVSPTIKTCKTGKGTVAGTGKKAKRVLIQSQSFSWQHIGTNKDVIE
jgi:hypothetical protein